MNIVRCYRCMRQFDADIDDICPHCGYYQKEQEKNQNLRQALPPGTILNGKYYVGCVLGVGGFAITYAAFNLVNRSKVAIKEYFPSSWASREPGELLVECGYGENAEQFRKGLNQFAIESHQLAMVGKHSGIVNVFETFMENETAYIVMEYVEGESLEDLLKKNGPMAYESLLQILVPICESLNKIHTYDRILHRDIAPDNIILQPNGRGKLIDFGASTQVTQMNENIILKHGYAPIEQYEEDDYCDVATDVYAMAAVIYHLLTGKRPPKSTERRAAIEAGGVDPLLSPIEAGAQIPQGLSDLLLYGLAIYRTERPQNMGEFAQYLATFLPQKTEFNPIPEPPKPPVKLIVGIVASVAVVILAVVVALFALQKHDAANADNKIEILNVADKGYEFDEAKERLEKWGEPNGIEFVVKENKTDSIPVGEKAKDKTVADQTPRKIEAGTKSVTVVLSLYEYVKPKEHYDNDEVKIPKVVNKSEENAQKEMNKFSAEYGVKVAFNEEYSDTVDKGTVIKQTPKSGTMTYKAFKKYVAEKEKEGVDPIVIVVSKGPKPTTATTKPSTTTAPATTRATTQAPTQRSTQPWTQATTRATTRSTTQQWTAPPQTAKPPTPTNPTTPSSQWTAPPQTTRPATTRSTTQPWTAPATTVPPQQWTAPPDFD